MTCLDILPTIAELTKTQLPSGIVLDGESVASVLTAKGYKNHHKLVYYVNNGVPEVAREEEWKLRRISNNGNTSIELFNLSWDPGERVNLAAKYSERVERLTKLLDEFPGKM